MHQRPAQAPISKAISIEECSKPMSPEFFLKLYTHVGQDYQWSDRLVYNNEELSEIINHTHTHIYLFKEDGKECGFSELRVEEEHVEILFFGLYPHAIGQGLGWQFLQLIIRQAWSFNPPKVQLNTCDWDHPRALKNYRRAGFKEVRRIMKNQ